MSNQYTPSKDGIQRRTVNVKFRLSKEDWNVLLQASKGDATKIQKLIECELSLSLEGFISDIKMGRRDPVEEGMI